jgi:RNA polymerase sigma factor (TIGR02999 family)
MEKGSKADVTQLLVAWSNGDPEAMQSLAPVVYRELHRLAGRYMRRESSGHLLQTTALVNEAYLRLIDWKRMRWQNRAHFLAMAAQIMRRILVDFAKTQKRLKRGGGAFQVSLYEVAEPASRRTANLVALDQALKILATKDPRQSSVVELRFFGGLSLEETAEVLKVSVGTVRRDWSLAKAWLYRELQSFTD